MLVEVCHQPENFTGPPSCKDVQGGDESRGWNDILSRVSTNLKGACVVMACMVMAYALMAGSTQKPTPM